MINRKQIKGSVLALLVLVMVSIGCSNDDDDAVPVTVTVEDFSVSINEGPDVGQVLGTVKAETSSGKLSFALSSQNPADAMQINATSGELTAKNATVFDFENRASVTGIVTVKSGDVSKEAKVTITIGGTNDETPEIANQTFTVKEDIADTEAIGTVIAIDKDNDDVTFTLTQNSNALFELTEAGELSLLAGKKLDFESASSHTLTVEVSDGTHQASAEITVAVENVVEAFITTWKTTEANEMIRIGINEDFVYDYTIDWGDGTVEDNLTTTQTHTYTTAGIYTVTVSGVFPAIYIAYSDGAHKLLTIEQWGDNEWESFYRAFTGCTNMTYNATDIPNLSKVTDISGMFQGCSKFTANLNNWNVSNVTDMESVFEEATSFNGDVSNWNVSKVVDMATMFLRANAFNGDLSSWNVSMVTRMNAMFQDATSFNGDLSSWNISEVRNMAEMLSETNISTANYDALLTKWATLPNLQSNLYFGVDGLTYCDSGIAGRNTLTNDKGWTISGDRECLR